ncbi:hypothetical protein KA075_02420 [Candidatus Saccharibacteria bacterium]|jgi:hypothetical protein|nr:hypothetical protein [Candidatus Saccharibacteria bacterium]
MSKQVAGAPRYSLSVPLQEVDAKWTGNAKGWPLHVTFVPDFWLPEQLNEAGLASMCLILAEGQKPFYVNFGEQQGNFGAKPAQEVVGPNRIYLTSLHVRALEDLSTAGCKLDNLDWVGKKYNPHVSTGIVIDPRLRVVVNSLMLVRKVDSGSETVKEIVGTWRLGKKGEQAKILRNI